jgi:hypothetical protein
MTANEKEMRAQRSTRDKTRRVRVYRHHDGNEHMPIVLTLNNIENRKEFMPGEEITLTDDEIEVLKSAIFESTLPIADESGIYQAEDPKAEAQRQNPGWEVVTDFRTATLYLRRNEPMYIVEPV